MRATASSDKKSIINRLILCMGIAYTILLAWMVLYKCAVPFIGDGSERTINLLPFKSNTSWEMQLNIAVFIPFGFYLAAAKKRRALLKLALAVLLTSAFFETAQFILSIGRSDITDLLMNTLGGVIGILAFYTLSWLFGKYERKATLAICILLILLELYAAASFVLSGQLNIGFMIIRI